MRGDGDVGEAVEEGPEGGEQTAGPDREAVVEGRHLSPSYTHLTSLDFLKYQHQVQSKHSASFLQTATLS